MTEPNDTLDALKLTVEAEFVPLSKSRNKDAKDPSLNWRVTVRCDGRDVLTTDYMQGSGHCPAYKASVAEMGNQNSIMRHDAIAFECERGKTAHARASGRFYERQPLPPPTAADVLYCLSLDGSAIDCAGFEDWCSNYGYDTDSRKAQQTYRDCLETGMALKAAIGWQGMEQLQKAFEDF